MDFFQGSTPPNFISFCLDIQKPESQQIPDSSSNVISASVTVRSPPPFPPIMAPKSRSSTDSNVDVTAYAEEKVRLHEEAQKLAGQQIGEQSVENPEEVEEDEEEEEERREGNEPRNLSFAHAKTDESSVLIHPSNPHTCYN